MSRPYRPRQMSVAGDPYVFAQNSMKGAYLGSAVGIAGGLYLGYVRNNNNPGWNMLGWSFLGSWAGGALGMGLGSLADGE